MHNLIFATNNQHKVDEIKALTGDSISIVSLKEAGIEIDIPEPYDTLERNATEKSSVIYGLTNKDCFGEDTGLEVDTLNGEPGVRSARYANYTSFNNNIDKLLFNLENKANRQAKFKTVLSLMLKGKEYKFEGICKGIIIAIRRGENGFGYDPIFIPDGSLKTFAEMNIEEKNIYSHRRKAVEKLVEFLKTRLKSN
ncbi:MAG: RdgB/HAM1 family non-canonical purine NTP pyrophosphatase [Chitinophagaceae bacterium]|jgi:XTP/dITP diphosphohydrolase|nr:RdgB/HAM1 family non-canonical purine NTP pyrophosphatase [Chitinophagaceae bacterium]